MGQIYVDLVYKTIDKEGKRIRRIPNNKRSCDN
jgi:hypothetical protein